LTPGNDGAALFEPLLVVLTERSLEFQQLLPVSLTERRLRLILSQPLCNYDVRWMLVTLK
jgi:hypothetical protein